MGGFGWDRGVEAVGLGVLLVLCWKSWLVILFGLVERG